MHYSFILFHFPGSFSQKNPVIDGWYADPEGAIFDNQYWIYPTYSARYEKQVFLDAFSSKDMATLEKTSTHYWILRKLNGHEKPCGLLQ